MQALTKKLAAKVLAIVDAGLVTGVGDPEPGKMCVEAAVCYAYGLPHSDHPPCVGVAVRSLKVTVNDKFRGSPKERAQLLRRLSIAQLGSDQIDQVEFAIRVALVVCQEPNFVQWANNWLSGKDRTANAAKAAYAAAYATADAAADVAADVAAKATAYASADADAAAVDAADADAAAWAARAAAYAGDADEDAAAWAARADEDAAAWAAWAARAAAYAGDADEDAAARADEDAAADAAAYAAAYAADAGDFSKFAEQVVKILIDMKSPGTKYLYLTERATK